MFPMWQDFARLAVSALLLFAGFYLIAWRWMPDLRPLSSVGFVRRPGLATEFAIGAALGWAIALAFISPAVLTGNLSFTFSWGSIALYRTLISVLTLGASAFVLQLVIAGLPSRLLVRAAGPTWTMLAIIILTACLAVARVTGEGSSVLFVALAASLFVSGFLRTRAIWLPLGLQLGWTFGLQVLFGVNSPYEPPSYSIVQGTNGGPLWLTGGAFGPEASSFAVVILIVSIAVLVRLTRNYAWHYTHQPIVGAGYAVEIAPPAEHIRQEQRAVQAMPLVQIEGALPQAGPPDSVR